MDLLTLQMLAVHHPRTATSWEGSLECAACAISFFGKTKHLSEAVVIIEETTLVSDASKAACPCRICRELMVPYEPT